MYAKLNAITQLALDYALGTLPKEDAILFEDVNPNQVYIMGYSAGGDGVYQLAPRMADQLAAAAMMAGHPNNASPLGLRNIGFTLHMGGQDKAYNRNGIARQWKQKLADLQENDPEGYRHEVTIHEKYGHTSMVTTY